MTCCGPFQWSIELQEFLQLYKDLPCLWDRSCSQYRNRLERERAYKKLVEKYKQIEEDVNCDVVKKRIEMFRNSYKWEHKKVLLAKERGYYEYKPSLWFYDHLRFLDNVMEWNVTDKRNSSTIQNQESKLPIEYVEPLMPKRFKTSPSNSSQGNDHQEEPFMQKRFKTSPANSSQGNDHQEEPLMQKRFKTSPANSSQGNDHQEEPLMQKRFKTSPANSSQGNDHQEAMFLLNQSSVCVDDKLASGHNGEIQHYDEASTSFGRTVGLQLKELAPEQRFIAEKLISDVIFNARINRLTSHTTIVVMDD